MKICSASSRILIVLSSLLTTIAANAQKDAVQDLSKSAKKGMISSFEVTDNNEVKAVFKMKTDKKSDQVVYEEYLFDNNLVFKGLKPATETKAVKPDRQVTSLAATVGGGNSFNVMSMSLKLEKETWEQKWDYDKQKYKWGKKLSKETVKPKNSEGKYRGFAAYANDDEGSVLVVASADTKEEDDKFSVLYISSDLTLKETVVPVSGAYSLVYTDMLKSGNFFLVMAPNKGSADLSKYVYVEFSPKAEVVVKTEFTAPSPNFLITDASEANGALYFCGVSTKKNEAFNSAFTSYAPIANPGYSTSANKQMDKYERSVYGEKFDNFHVVKFENGKLAFATTTPVKAFEAKAKTPPSQKKAHPYEGQKFTIQNFLGLPNGEFLVAGQIMDRKISGSNYSYSYYDIVCLHFDASGQLKAQYAVEKVNDDKKSEAFQAQQRFYPSKDGKSVYWELMEVKGTKGYSNFVDAYNGDMTFTKHFFPRIARIDLNSTSLSDFTELGQKQKYVTYQYDSWIYSEKDRTRYYVGHDEDYEKLWVAKYTFD